MKKLVLPIVLVGLLAVTGYTFLHSSSPPPAPVQHKQETTPKAETWNGVLTRGWNVTFIHAGQQLQLEALTFSGLNTDKTQIVLTMTTPKPTNGLPPAWLTERKFTVRAADGSSWTPTLSAAAQGDQIVATLTVSGLPTSQLVNGNVGLIITTPEGPFSVALVPPPAPDGHSYEEAARQSASSSTSSGKDKVSPRVSLKLHGAGKHRYVTVFAVDNVKLGRLLVIVDGKRKRLPVHDGHTAARVKIKVGRHSIRARATDAAGNKSKVARLTISRSAK